ncbi:MAG: radical SAM protein [Bacillota bacterium]
MDGIFRLRRTAVPAGPKRWVPSRFNVRTHLPDGRLVIYNSYSGQFVVVPSEASSLVKASLVRPVEDELDSLQAQLFDGGFLIPEEANELHRARYMHEVEARRPDRLHLILMPHENCNFRCVYCYEDFAHNKMDPSVRVGLKEMVRQRARNLSHLDIGWFGGEPLLALDVIEELSTAFQEQCSNYGISYSASITTNGYLLTSEAVNRLFTCNVRHMQVTLDGPPSVHNKRRKLAGGGGTFHRILENLIELKNRTDPFQCVVRVNYDKESNQVISTLISRLKDSFSGDRRFSLYFFPVGQWGGPNDENLPVCDAYEAIQLGLDLSKRAINSRMPVLQRELLAPNGSVCYASNPNAFVIGAEGSVYKCTVALDRPYNRLGRIKADGNLVLDQDKHALWIMSDESGDSVCERCYVRPACQGSACPLMRIEYGQRPCPPWKKQMTKVLQLIALEEDLLATLDRKA